MCVGCLVNILLFLMSNILLFSKTLIPPKDHYKLASHSSFLLILLLSLLRFAWFLVCGEQECLLQVTLDFVWLVCWMEGVLRYQAFGSSFYQV